MQLRLVTIRESINFFDCQNWRSGTRGKNRHTAVEVDVRIGNAAKQRFNEAVHTLARLARQFREASLDV
jgi:hypothetical protein